MKSLKRTGQVIMTSVLIATIGFGGISNTVTSLFDTTPAQEISMSVEADSSLLSQAGNFLSDIFGIPEASASYELSPELVKSVDKVINNFYKKLASKYSKNQQMQVLQTVSDKIDDVLAKNAKKYDERSIALIEYLDQSIDAKILSLKGSPSTNPVIVTPDTPSTVTNDTGSSKPVNVAPVSDTLKAMQDTYKALGGNVYSSGDKALSYTYNDSLNNPTIQAEIMKNTAAIQKMYEDGTIKIGEVMSDSSIPLAIITGMSKDQLQQLSMEWKTPYLISSIRLQIKSDRNGQTYKQVINVGSTTDGYNDAKYGYTNNGTLERGSPLYESYKQEVIKAYNKENPIVGTRDVPLIKMEKLPLGDNIQSKIENREMFTVQEGYDAWVIALEAEGLMDKVEITKGYNDDGSFRGYTVWWKIDAPGQPGDGEKHSIFVQNKPTTLWTGMSWVSRFTLNYYLFDR